MSIQPNPKPCSSVYFGAFRSEENQPDLQVIENTTKKGEIKLLTENIKKGYYSAVAKSKKIPAKVAFHPTAEEKRMIQIVQDKLGINKATEVLRMGLKQLADDCVKSVG